MSGKDLFLVITPLLSLLLGSFLTYFFSIKTKEREAILKFKEEKYSNLLIKLEGFVGKTASAGLKRDFFHEQYKSWIYSSDEVVKAINRMLEVLMKAKGQAPDPQIGRKAIGEIVLAMRKDLIGRTELTDADFRYTDVID